MVGLGNMGGRIARRLLDAGYDVCGFDTDDARARQWGVSPMETVAHLVAEANAIFLSLPDSRAVESVVFEDGLLDNVRGGQFVIDLSTSSPDSSRKIFAALADRGTSFLDCGISGGAALAERGELTLMIGGERIAFEHMRGTLSAFGAKVEHMGQPGAGHTAKLLNNFLNAVTLASTAEVMVAAKKAELDLEVFLDVVNSSSGMSFATAKRFPHIIRGNYLEGGLTSRLMLKDILLYVESARSLGVPSLMSPGCLSAFGLSETLGYGDKISNHVVDAIGEIAGGVRLHEAD